MLQATSVAPESSVRAVANLMGFFRQCQHQQTPNKATATNFQHKTNANKGGETRKHSPENPTGRHKKGEKEPGESVNGEHVKQ